MNSQKLLIQGANGFGKSAIMKSLYEAFGTTPIKVDRRWKTADVSTCLEFEYGGSTWFAVKALGVYSLFDQDGNRRFWGQRLVKDWGPKLAEFFDFKLELADKEGETVTPPPAYLVAPFYVDQDGGWKDPWKSFDDFYLPGSARTLADYHSGIRPDEFYLAKAELAKERTTLDALEAGVETLRDAVSQIQQIEGTSPTYDLAEFESEIESLVAESSRLLQAQTRHRQVVSELHEEAHLLRGEAHLLLETLKEMRGEFELASALPQQVECPTCGYEYQNSLADRFALIADEGVLSKALTDAQARLARVTEREKAERRKLEEVSRSLELIQKTLDVRKESLSLGDVIVAAGKTEAARILRRSLDEKIVAADGSRNRAESFRAAMSAFADARRTGEILKFFRARLSAYSSELDVQLEDPDRQSIASVKAARGSEGPRSLLAYYYAFLHTKAEFTKNVRFPIVIDAPNQQGQDKVHLPQMINFIFDHVPDDAQTIVATEDASGFDLEDVTIATYGEAKRQVLRETEFETVKAVFQPYFQTILSMG
ncbi:hypothetical protein DC522_12995 [Microvirga sp. KLBC 81]|nr:hypothetical protein DC522_12995 [Microvirga sp. KLBC 81]